MASTLRGKCSISFGSTIKLENQSYERQFFSLIFSWLFKNLSERTEQLRFLQINTSTWYTKAPERLAVQEAAAEGWHPKQPTTCLTGSVALQSLHWPMCSEFQTSTALAISLTSYCCHLTFSKEDKSQRLYPSKYHTNQQWSSYFIYFTVLSWIKTLWFTWYCISAHLIAK